MDKFCTNCGEKLYENAMFCVKCGTSANTATRVPKKELKGLGITSLILGIIAGILSCFALFRFILDTNSLFDLHLYKIIVSTIQYLVLPFILGVLTIIFGAVSYNRSHNLINLSGLVLGFFSLTFCILSFLILWMN